MTLTRRLAGEALGTAFLLAVVVGSGIMGERLAAGNTAVALLANSIATGCGLWVLITIFAPISGAHFNPAVTLAFAISGEFKWSEVPAYIATQIVAAFVGVAAAHLMFELPLFSLSEHVRAGPAQWFSEGVATAGLLLTIWLGDSRAAQVGPGAGRGLHHRRLLVHRLHLACESGSHPGAGGDQHFCRHPPDRHAWIYRRAAGGCAPGHARRKVVLPRVNSTRCLVRVRIGDFFSQSTGRLRQANRVRPDSSKNCHEPFHLVLKPKTPSQSAPGGLARKSAIRSP